ncbi:hypothetical protein M3Y94_01255800 [Aphelenchoides besseyi]|nr:hypothetical protein M3Y94_01255800 [Aphelenchoides besseyi]
MSVDHTISSLHEITKEDCVSAAELRNNWFMTICSGLNVLFALVSLSLTIYLFTLREFRRLGSLMSRNVRLIGTAGLLVFSMGVLLPCIFYSYIFASVLQSFVFMSSCLEFLFHKAIGM